MIRFLRRLKRIILALFLFLVLLLSIGFVLWNTTPVPLSLGLFEFRPQPLAVWLVLTLIIGVFVGLLMGSNFFKALSLRARLRRVSAQLSHTEKELERMKAQQRIEKTRAYSETGSETGTGGVDAKHPLR